MTTKSMAYDHPAYTARVVLSGNSESSGAGNAHPAAIRFAAFTDMLVKSIQVSTVVGGTNTANTNIFLARKVVVGTSTSTSTIGSFGTSIVTTNVTPSITLAAGNVLEVLCSTGTDATAVFAVGAELLLTPGANVTV